MNRPAHPRAFVPADVRHGAARPVRLSGDTFEAWHESGVEIDVSAAETLDEALAIATPQSSHKQHFVIQHNRKDARRFLHFYYVSKSSKRGTWRGAYDGGPRVFEGNLEVKHVLEMQIGAPYQPVAPWQWSDEDRTGAKHGICPDLAGRDLTLVSQ